MAAGSNGCNNDSNEATAIQAPAVSAITDDAFRAAAKCPDCAVTARSTVILPLTGKVVTEAKLRSQSTKAPHDGAVDGQGNAVDARALLAAEGAAKIAKQGKLRDDVYARSLASSKDLVPVTIWADIAVPHARREQMASDSRLRDAQLAQTAGRLHATTSKVTSWLDGRGFNTRDRGTGAPVITADVPAGALAELGRLDGVALVELSHPDVPAGTTWFGTVRGASAQLVVSSVPGQAFCNGEGSQPENYTYLDVGPYQIFDSGAQADWHTTWTTEIIAGTTTAYPRMAPDAPPYIAGWNGTSNTKYAAWEWCYGNGIQNLNRSASTGTGAIGPVAEDMAQDYYAYNWPYPVITLAAGNCESNDNLTNCSGTAATSTVTNRSYNTLVVGASDDNNTTGISDDYLAGFSQYINPVSTHNDHELPNLVAPGSSGYTTGIGAASTIGRGTSGAAPIVLGTVLLMKGRDSNFSIWPEMMRATVMAASTHPIDGGRTTAISGVGDIKQGAGLLNAGIAVSLANPNFFVSGPNNTATEWGRTVRYYDFSTDFPNSSYISDPYNIVTASDNRLRVVAAFDATAQGCNTADGSGCTGVALDGDLDLQVSKYVSGSWQQVCVSQTWDSSWELCDIAVNSGETYKAELTKHATNSSGTYVGIAWTNYSTFAE